MGRQDYESETLITHALRGEGFDASEDGTGRDTPLVPIAFSCKDHGADVGEISPTLRSMGHDGSHANAGGQVAVAFNLRGREGGAMPEVSDMASLRAASGGSSRSYVAGAIGLDEEQNAIVEGMGCLKARTSGGGFEGTVMTPTMAVRRLTPTECERLQGFPDSYTAVTHRKKPAADGPRYKALGNSWAVPCARWIVERMQEVDRL